MNENFYVYIISNKKRSVFYIGVTNNLQRRVAEHQSKSFPGFTQKYNLTDLIWYEHFREVNSAIRAEKKLKGYRREKKLAVIKESNPTLAKIEL